LQTTGAAAQYLSSACALLSSAEQSFDEIMRKVVNTLLQKEAFLSFLIVV
jgi:hypothetical protein